MRLSRAVVGAVVFSALLVLVTAGCGGSSSKIAAKGSAQAANPPAAGPSSSQLKKFNACMKSHGVSNFAPTSNPSGQGRGAGANGGHPPGTGTTGKQGLVPPTSTTGGQGPAPGANGGQSPGTGTTTSPGLVPRSGANGAQGPSLGKKFAKRSTLTPAQKKAQSKALAACGSLLPSGGTGQPGSN